MAEGLVDWAQEEEEEAITNSSRFLPKTQEEVNHSDKKMAFSNWTLFAVQAVMLRYGRSSKEPQSLLLE